ncbi:MAG: hypothetical protein WKF83_06050 [Nocardioidaceae bacterium]
MPVSSKNDCRVAGPSRCSISSPDAAPSRDDGGVRGGSPRAQLEVQPEIGDESLGHQADQVGVARQAGGDTWERFCADCGPTGGLEAFQHDRVETRASQVGGGDEALCPPPTMVTSARCVMPEA